MRRSRKVVVLGAAAGSVVLLAACGNMNPFCANDFCGRGDAGDADGEGRLDARAVDGEAGERDASDAREERDEDAREDARESGDAHERDDAHEGSDAGDGAEEGDATETGPAPCDPLKTPQENACVLTDALGVFVAPASNGGSDTMGNGSRAHPYATLGNAISRAVAAGKRVYACGATYAETLVVGVAADGVAIYGGLECPDAGDGGVADAGMIDSSTGPWSYSGALAAVAPASTGFALDVESLSKGAHFEDMSFTAQAANPGNAGESSIAVMVNASTKVSFLRVSAIAGDGAAGAPGAGVTTSNACATATQGGSAATTLAGGLPGNCTCGVAGTSQGGTGGGGSAAGGGSGLNGSATPSTTFVVTFYDGTGGAGQILAPPAKCVNGDDGANGSPASGGAAGAGGSLGASGWTVASAGAGTPGNPGQGGGGGGGSLTIGGAGGGAGGCGGNGAGGGGGGGASLAVALVSSAVTFNDVSLQTGSGGAGGKGAQGEQGQAGGTNGFGAAQCSGGTGGQGAGGSGGGGGAGGPSAGIAWTGSIAPVLDGKSTSTTTTLTSPSAFTGVAGGSAGSGGLGGLAAPGDPGNSGIAGNVGSAGPAGALAAVQGL